MKKGNIKYILFLLLLVAVSSCSNTQENSFDGASNELFLNITGLDDLGVEFIYEGWIIVGVDTISTGTFSVNNHELSQTNFEVDALLLANATEFMISIEPFPDLSSKPSNTKMFIGTFDNGDIATLTTKTVASSFGNVTGRFMINTQTESESGKMYNEIWFEDNSLGAEVLGLELPTLEAGWKYEAWVVIDGIPVSTGTFLSVENAPSGSIFPNDIIGEIVVITVEPHPDNSEVPFTFKPLAGDIESNATGIHELVSNVVVSYPYGTASRY